jgi:hypothetical protein
MWTGCWEASKSKTLLFAGLYSKKWQAKLALFWSKGKETPLPGGVCLGSTRNGSNGERQVSIDVQFVFFLTE